LEKWRNGVVIVYFERGRQVHRENRVNHDEDLSRAISLEVVPILVGPKRQLETHF